MNSVRNEHSPVVAGPATAASFTRGPGAAGCNRRSGPVGGQGGGATSSGMSSAAFHQSWSQRSPVWNVPDTSTDDPAGPVVDDRITAGGLLLEGVGQSGPPVAVAVAVVAGDEGGAVAA